MKEQYVSALSEGDRVDSVFVLRSKELRSARSGECYLHMHLADRTGSMPAIRFRPDPRTDSAPAGTVVRARGRVTTYRGVPRISLESLRPCDSFDRLDLLPRTPRNPNEMADELWRAIGAVEDPRLSALLHAVFGDDVFFARFIESPAAESGASARLGRLVEHTLAVARICDRLAAVYEQADADLLLAGALLHDIGQVDALALDGGISRTDEGRLLGHALLGERRVREAAGRMTAPLPDERLALVSHLIMSHSAAEAASHGEAMTLEALLLAHADSADTRTARFLHAVEGASMAEERWAEERDEPGVSLYVPHRLDSAGTSFRQSA